MPGPSYQQFQGYPNVVGNYFQGLGAGRDRAATQFSDRQTLETQNALVRQAQVAGSPVQSYPQLQAMQMHAKQQLDMYGPALQTAVENENYAMRDAIVETLRKTNNPMLGQFAAIAATAKKLDKDQYGYDITFTTPEQRTAAYNADRYLQSVYPSAEAIQLNTPYRVSVQGMPGTPSSHTTKFEAVSRTAGKPGSTTVDVKDQKQLDDLAEQFKDNEEAMAAIEQAQQLLTANPAGVTVTLPGIAKVGAKAIKTSTKETVDFSADSTSKIAEILNRSDVSDTVKASLRTLKAVEGQNVRLESPVNGKYTSMKIVSPKGTGGAGAGGVGGGAFPVLKYNDPGRYYGTLFKKDSGETEFATLVSRFLSASVGGRNAFQAVGLSAGKQNDTKREEFLARVSDFMAQRGITQEDITTAAGALSATKQLAKQQGMLEINASVAERGFEMLADLRKKGQISTGAIPLLNHAENVLRTWTGDAPPGAAQGILTETLVDYAKVVSGQTSTAGVTMYAAKLARELMELKDNPAQFQLKLDQYRKLMKARIAGGKTMLKGLSHLTDVGNKKETPSSLDDYITAMVRKYPQYKGKTRAEWQAAYDKQYPGGR